MKTFPLKLRAAGPGTIPRLKPKNFDIEKFGLIFDAASIPGYGLDNQHFKSVLFAMKLNPVVFVFVVTCAVACNHDRFHADISDENVIVSLSRFEKDLFSADPALLEELIPAWKQKYGTFFQHFSYIIKLGSTEDPEFAEKLRQFVTDRTNYLVFKRTQDIFPTLDTFTMELTKAFRYYHHYFPNKPIPRIVTYISGFNQSAVTDDSLLAIGLDKYLGTQEKLYREIGIYNYLLINMYPGKMVSDCIHFWGETEFPFNDSINNLISNMIYRGRLLFFTSAMQPSVNDSVNWGFSGRGLDFCITNEKYLWTMLIEKKFLFSTDRFTIDKFILEGPFTKDFGRDSPARAAVWIGYRIVSSYMDRNRDISISGLMEETDYMKILNLSAYNT